MLIKNKKTKKLKVMVIALIIILLILSVIGITFILESSKEVIYEKSSRVKNISEEKNKDNSDKFKTIGWLKVQGTNIDTPIITYLDDDENSMASKNNYLWNLNKEEKLFNKVSIMGHNLLNLSAKPEVGLKEFSRFDDLMSFVYYDFIKDNKYIQYTIDGKDYVYKIFAVGFDYQYNLDVNNNGNYSKKQLQKYIDKLKKKSIYDFNIDVNENDKVISLITCTRMFGTDDEREFVVSARLVRKGEKLTNYSVNKSNKYKKIEGKLKGDVENEKI